LGDVILLLLLLLLLLCTTGSICTDPCCICSAGC
jgi:hypothetical protein